MDRSLDSLATPFKQVAALFLARLVEAQIPVLIINTRRTDAEQEQAIKTGHSHVAHSKHQDGLAMDVCPWETFTLHGSDKLLWDTSDPVWLKIGTIAETLGLRWGGRFHPLNAQGIGWDPGHVEQPDAPMPPMSVAMGVVRA